MSGLRLGGLFEGYGGLTAGVQSVLGGDLAWYSEIDRGALKILEHRHAGVPNLGDITAVDWSTVEPVDVLTGGSPCQDLSHAGRRAGMSEGTRSNLWVAMREAIAALRPPLVIWENVRGAYSAGADSELETRPGLLGSVRRRDGEPVLRALGRVLGDLSDLGYDAQWHGLRAADVGACHPRFRVFMVAANASGTRLWQHRRGAPSQEAGADKGYQLAGDGSLLPTPRATDGTKGGPNQRGSSGDLMLPSAVALLPTPTTTQRGTDAQRDTRPGAGPNLHNSVALLPNDEPLLNGIAASDLWGDYAAAIARWEAVLGRPAPPPTMTSAKGNPQLAADFVEFLMGLPAGWVTDVPGITRNEALRALGNGVVPQQCAAALRLMLGQAVAA